MVLLVFIFSKNNQVCFAEDNGRRTINIYSSNFWEDFYFNDNLYGESGTNYIVKFMEDIDLDIRLPIYTEYVQKIESGAAEGGPVNKTFTALIDGNNCTISNFKNDSGLAGPILKNALFNKLNNCKIRNLTIKDCEFNGAECAAVLCLEAKSCIFENVKIENCLIYSVETFSFAEKLDECYFVNCDVKVSATASESCFEFAKTIENCAFKFSEIDTTFVNGGEATYFENDETLAAWTSANDSSFAVLDGLLRFSLDSKTSGENVLGSAEQSSGASNSVSQSDKMLNLNAIQITFTSLAGLAVLIKIFGILLTKKK